MTNSQPRETISFGATLARAMTDSETCAYFANLDGRKALGIIEVVIMPSLVPNVRNTEARLIDCPTVEAAVQALRVAAARLPIIHKMGAVPEPRIVNFENAKERHRAEQLVDTIRSARVGSTPTLHTFDHTRENCVRAIMAALAAKE